MGSRGWLTGYIACSLLHLLSLAAGWEWLRFTTKPLLMLILLFSGAGGWVRTTLFFSWLGDIFLLGEGQAYFISGLGAFLLAHLCYIFYFLLRRRQQAPRPAWNPYVIIGVSLYAGLFYFLLAPHLETALKAPVFVYTWVIAAMFCTSFFVNGWCVAGAALFLASDSLLAVNSFVQPFAGASLLVMLTYAAAQLGIVWGSLQPNKADEKN